VWHVFASERIAKGRAWQHLEQRLRNPHAPFQIHVSKTQSELDSFVDEAIRSGATRFIPAGGDGATQLLVNALMRHAWETPPIIALLPLGSGCDFARSFGQRNHVEQLVGWLEICQLHGNMDSDSKATSAQLQIQDVDVGIAKGEWGSRYFVNVASIGITAAIVRRAAGLSWLGAMRYITAFWLVLPTYARRRFLLRSENEEFQSSSMLGVVANGRFFGGGFYVAPQAKVDDGLFQLLIASASRVQLLSVLFRLWRGTHLRSSYVRSVQVPDSSVVCDPPTEVEADGEYLGRTPVEFSIKPKAIRLVYPKEVQR